MKTFDHNPNKTLSEKLAPLGAILLLITIIFAMATTSRAQTFHPNRGYSIYSPAGVKAKKHKKTLAQRTMNKIRYASKRHNNEAFAIRERRKAIKRNY